MIVSHTDLETVNPSGRVDVLAYRGVQKLVEHVESQYGLQGVWEVLKPHVNQVINSGLAGVEIPTEAKILLAILQANYQPEKKDGL